MIENIFLDMDETILDFTMAERNALTLALQTCGKQADEAILQAYHDINLSQWKLLEKGLLTREVLKVRRFEILVDRLQLAIDAKTLAKIYESRLEEGYFYKEGAREVLEELQGKYRLYLLSNGSSTVQHSRIAGAKLAPFFDGIYISEDVGYDKPNPAYFEACFSDIEEKSGAPVDRAASVMVGDSLSSDMQGGFHAGITTVWLNEAGQPAREIKPDYEIASIKELPDLLERLQKF